MAAAPSTRLLRSHPAQLNRKLGITSGLLTGRSNVSVACEGGARFTGASDSSKLVSARSTGGAADPPKTPARRNRTKIRQCRFTATLLQVLERYSRRHRMSNGCSRKLLVFLPFFADGPCTCPGQ